jgi:hypothetical protein
MQKSNSLLRSLRNCLLNEALYYLRYCLRMGFLLVRRTRAYLSHIRKMPVISEEKMLRYPICTFLFHYIPWILLGLYYSHNTSRINYEFRYEIGRRKIVQSAQVNALYSTLLALVMISRKDKNIELKFPGRRSLECKLDRFLRKFEKQRSACGAASLNRNCPGDYVSRG